MRRWWYEELDEFDRAWALAMLVIAGLVAVVGGAIEALLWVVLR